MPVLIDEVVLELQEGVTEDAGMHLTAQQMPLSVAEAELVQTLTLIQQRQDRLKID
jgi:hypothetical protein